jgi:hypothetical protein
MRTIGWSLLCAPALLLAACGGGGGGSFDAEAKLVEFLTPAALPQASTGQPYFVDIEAHFPNPPGNYAVTGGALPPGLVLREDDGEISGYPREVGSFQFELGARDGIDGKLPAGRDVTYAEARRVFTLQIARGPVQILPQTLPIAQYRGSYGYQIDAAGGTKPYTFLKTGGTLPAGLVVSPSGFVGSFPTEALEHPYTFDVTVFDAAGEQHTRTLTVDVVILPLLIETVEVPDASEGFPYDTSFTLASAGGGPPHSWSQVLPPGPGETALSTINMTISNDGHLRTVTDAGPPLAGDFTFTVQVVDQAMQAATRQYTLHVTSSPVLSSISPRISNKPGPFTATGLKFMPGATLVFNPGAASSQTITPTWVNGTTLTFPTAPPLSVKGPITVRVVNPDGGFDDLPAAMLYPADNISFGTKGFIASGLSTFGLDAADIDGDDLADIIHAGAAGFKPFSAYALTSATGGLNLIHNDGGLNFTITQLDGGNWSDAKFVDVDLDGDRDIVALGYTGSTAQIRTWQNDGDGNMTSWATSPMPAIPGVPATTTEMAVGHFNNDTFPDIAYASGSRQLYGSTWTTLNVGGGSFSPAAAATSNMTTTAFYGVNSLACDRLNADTISDVIAGASYYSSAMPQLRVSNVNSGGSFAGWTTAGNNTHIWSGTSSVRSGNFLNHALPCVVVCTVMDPPDSGGPGNNFLTVYWGSGLSSQQVLSVQQGMCKSIGVGDFDFDGIDDFAVSHKVANAGNTNPPLTGQPDRVMAYKGSTGGLTQTLNLQVGTPTVTAAQSGRVASGDLDGDGRPDLLVATSFWATDNQASTSWQRGDSADGTPLGIVFYLNTSQ